MEIELKHINKRFGKVHANNDISMTFGRARIIGFLGENGAGKSTMMKILSGFYQADSGEIWIDGQYVDYRNPQTAIAAGVGMLQQDPLDVAAFSVLENFTYGQDKSGFRINKQEAADKLSELCQRLSFELEPETNISLLSVAQRQQLEIIRLLAQGVQTLILDEPTTGISAEQKEILFDTLRNLAHNDGMTIILVSHKLEDVIALCNEVVVLRAGRFVGGMEMPATKTELVTLMFGQELAPQTRERRDLSAEPLSLQLQNLNLKDGRITMTDVSLDVHAGEVIGLAGLDGNGQQVLMRAAAGLLPTIDGKVLVNNVDISGQPYHKFMRAGVMYCASGRLEEGLIAGLTLTEHAALIREQGVFIDWERTREHTKQQIETFNVVGKEDDYIEMLSGGNQQRSLMALLPDKSAALILEQPTRGLDVDSIRWIWKQLLKRCDDGTSIIFSSADLDELVTYSDRIIVCYAGQTFMINDPTAVTINELGHLIGGAFEEYSR